MFGRCASSHTSMAVALTLVLVVWLLQIEEVAGQTMLGLASELRDRKAAADDFLDTIRQNIAALKQLEVDVVAKVRQ